MISTMVFGMGLSIVRVNREGVFSSSSIETSFDLGPGGMERLRLDGGSLTGLVANAGSRMPRLELWVSLEESSGAGDPKETAVEVSKPDGTREVG